MVQTQFGARQASSVCNARTCTHHHDGHTITITTTKHFTPPDCEDSGHVALPSCSVSYLDVHVDVREVGRPSSVCYVDEPGPPMNNPFAHQQWCRCGPSSRPREEMCEKVVQAALRIDLVHTSAAVNGTADCDRERRCLSSIPVQSDHPYGHQLHGQRVQINA
jgi:hypothetical protein